MHGPHTGRMQLAKEEKGWKSVEPEAGRLEGSNVRRENKLQEAKHESLCSVVQ